MLVQLVSVPVRNLPDVSFVYGLLHLYKDVGAHSNVKKGSRSTSSALGGAAQQVDLEAGFPLQGIYSYSVQRKGILVLHLSY